MVAEVSSFTTAAARDSSSNRNVGTGTQTDPVRITETVTRERSPTGDGTDDRLGSGSNLGSYRPEADLPAGAKAAIGLGVTLGVVLLGVIIWFVMRRGKEKEMEEEEEEGLAAWLMKM